MLRSGAMKRATAEPRGTTEVAHPITLHEWADLDDDIDGELIDGFLEEEEMPTVLHETIVGWLIALFRRLGVNEVAVVLVDV